VLRLGSFRQPLDVVELPFSTVFSCPPRLIVADRSFPPSSTSDGNIRLSAHGYWRARHYDPGMGLHIMPESMCEPA
jgi:hypothetical protein